LGKRKRGELRENEIDQTWGHSSFLLPPNRL